MALTRNMTTGTRRHGRQVQERQEEAKKACRVRIFPNLTLIEDLFPPNQR